MGVNERRLKSKPEAQSEPEGKALEEKGGSQGGEYRLRSRKSDVMVLNCPNQRKSKTG